MKKMLLLVVAVAGCAAEPVPDATPIRCADYECCPVSACADGSLACDYTIGKCVIPSFTGDCGHLDEPCCVGGCNAGLACTDGACKMQIALTCDAATKTCTRD